MSILLEPKEIRESYAFRSQPPGHKVVHGDIAKAQAKKIADAIDSMTADGWWLEDIVKAIRKEIE